MPIIHTFSMHYVINYLISLNNLNQFILENHNSNLIRIIYLLLKISHINNINYFPKIKFSKTSEAPWRSSSKRHGGLQNFKIRDLKIVGSGAAVVLQAPGRYQKLQNFLQLSAWISHQFNTKFKQARLWYHWKITRGVYGSGNNN